MKTKPELVIMIRDIITKLKEAENDIAALYEKTEAISADIIDLDECLGQANVGFADKIGELEEALEALDGKL